MTNYELLINRLDQFIRKYYLNKLIRGSLYALGLVLGLFILFNLMESYFYFGKGGRKMMFYSFLGISAFSIGQWVVLPLLNYFHLGKIISHKQAAQIIGNHFGTVKDKLLNILQLKDQSTSSANTDLILASIQQKTEEIKVVPFKKAIDLSKNRKYLRYALPPFLVLIVLLFAAPSLITDSTKRIINNNRDFEREAPFSFQINTNDLEVVQFENFELTVNVAGTALPNEVYIDIDNYQYKLQKKDNQTFTYTFNNVQKNTTFKVLSGPYNSNSYELKVLLKPKLQGFSVALDYPGYTGRKDETLSNIGDVLVPVGTTVRWDFNTNHTKAVELQFSDEPDALAADQNGTKSFSFKRRAMQNENYKIFISNDEIPMPDSVSYFLSVIPDAHPSISAKQFEDSTATERMLFFVGDASDDYGLSNLAFNYRIKTAKGKEGALQTIKLDKPAGRQIQFDYNWNLSDLNLKPGDQLTYYFETFDNDGIKGPKSAKTGVMSLNLPSIEDLKQQEEDNNEAIKDDLKESIEETKKLQDEIKKLKEKLLQEKDLGWQNKKELEKLLEKQKELEEKIKNAQEKLKENLQNQEQINEPNEELQEKQEQLQKLFDEVLSDEMKELMRQIEELLQELERDDALEMMEEMEFNDQDLEMELDRMYEMFKQLEVEKDLQEQIEKLEELAERQEELSEKTEENEAPKEELLDEQEQIDKEFQEAMEKQEEIEKKNEELENPKNMGDSEEMDQQQEEIEQEMKDSKDNLQKGQNGKASESQQKAAEKMQEMADGMALNMEQGEMEQMEEDMKSLRQLLENLVGLSYDQEDLISDLSITNVFTPKYTELTQIQFKLKDDFRLVEDSLRELSKRVYQIESFVTDKVSDINRHLKSSLDQLEERRKDNAAKHQQFTMTNVNDLALMLSEVMNQMQQQMSGMMAGSQMCNKPGGKSSNGSKPMDKITQGQQQISEQMKQMKESLQKGKGGKGGMAQEFAEIAAKQAALRKALRKLQQDKMKNGENGSMLKDIMDKMNQNETDLVNKRLNNEMMKRQQDILTRLLEAERAEREREYDNKREAERASNTEPKIPPSMEEYLKKREAEVDFFKEAAPNLKPYYKHLVDEYYKSLKKS